MAVAKCGQHWSWGSLIWCSGKKVNEYSKNEYVDKMCCNCPWWKGNKKDEN